MNRRQLVLSVWIALAAAPMAWAKQSYADQVIQHLTEEGYSNIKVGTTLLGRIRIVAESANGRREIILNPNTGEILRDVWIDAAGNLVVPTIIGASPGEGGSGSDGDDDDSGSGGSDGDDDDSGSGGSGDDDQAEDDADDAADQAEDDADDAADQAEDDADDAADQAEDDADDAADRRDDAADSLRDLRD